MNKTNTQPCPVCGSKMRFEKRDDVLSYQGKEKRIKTLGWWCTSCDEAIFDGSTRAPCRTRSPGPALQIDVQFGITAFRFSRSTRAFTRGSAPTRAALTRAASRPWRAWSRKGS